MKGEYRTDLLSGGTLVVTEDKWYISYYFIGPDLRYRGTGKTVTGDLIDQYIMAWRNNFKKYLELKSSIKSEEELLLEGEMGMYIHVSPNRGGVSLDRYNLWITTPLELETITSDYVTAKLKASRLMETVESMNNLAVDVSEYQNPNDYNLKNGEIDSFTKNDIAIAYNKLFDLKNTSFTREQAKRRLACKHSGSLLLRLVKEGILRYNSQDDDYSFFNHYNKFDYRGVNWVLDYYFESISPYFEKFVDYYKVKGKNNKEYIAERLNISKEDLERIWNTFCALGLESSYCRTTDDVRSFIINTASLHLFYTPLPIKV